jgi:hypothetical protein
MVLPSEGRETARPTGEALTEGERDDGLSEPGLMVSVPAANRRRRTGRGGPQPRLHFLVECDHRRYSLEVEAIEQKIERRRNDLL